MALADWLGKGQSPVAQVTRRGLNGKLEWVKGKLLKGQRRGLRFEREFLSAVFRKEGHVRDIVTQDGGHRTRWRTQYKMEDTEQDGGHRTRWRTQNKMESAGLGLLFQTLVP